MGDEAQGGKIIYTVDYNVPEKEKKKMDFLMKQQPKLDKLYQSFSKSGAGAVATGAGLIGAAVMMVTAGGGVKSGLGAMWDLFGLISDLAFIALWPILKPLLAAFIKAIQSGRLQWLIDALVFFGKIIISFLIIGYYMFKFFKTTVDVLVGVFRGFWDAAVMIVGGIGDVLGGIWDTIVGAFQPLINAFNTLIGWIQQLINTLTGWVKGITQSPELVEEIQSSSWFIEYTGGGITP